MFFYFIVFFIVVLIDLYLVFWVMICVLEIINLLYRKMGWSTVKFKRGILQFVKRVGSIWVIIGKEILCKCKKQMYGEKFLRRKY